MRSRSRSACSRESSRQLPRKSRGGHASCTGRHARSGRVRHCRRRQRPGCRARDASTLESRMRCRSNKFGGASHDDLHADQSPWRPCSSDAGASRTESRILRRLRRFGLACRRRFLRPARRHRSTATPGNPVLIPWRCLHRRAGQASKFLALHTVRPHCLRFVVGRHCWSTQAAPPSSHSREKRAKRMPS